MQAVKVSWVGQTFALARCSDSRERRPRSRKTKEERKKLVEFFVKKYQNSNKGSFPSLNLTHKEVGGSFYTVRELVRELIQENRVLGPGNPNSKVLNLERFPDDYEAESLMDTPDHLPILSIGHAIDCLSTEHQVSIEQTHDIQTQGMSAPLPNNHSVTHVIDCKASDHSEMNCSNGSYLSGELLNAEYDEVEVTKSSGQPQDNSQVNQQIDPEAQGHVLNFFESASPLGQSVSASSSSELSLDAYDILKAGNNIEAMDSSVKHNVCKISDNNLEQPMISKNSSTRRTIDPLYEHLVSYEIEVFPIPSAAKTCSPDGSPLQADNSNSSLELSEVSEPKEASKQVYKDLLVNGTVSTETSSVPAKVQAAKSLTLATPQSLTPMLSTTRIELAPASKREEKENLVTNAGSACSRSVSLHAKGKPVVEADSDHKKVACRICASSSISGEKPKENSVAPENQFWAVIHAFVASFIKFWS